MDDALEIDEFYYLNWNRGGDNCCYFLSHTKCYSEIRHTKVILNIY